jgi:hypothetical protein
LCFRGLLIRLVTGSSWETSEALVEYKVYDTTLRARRDRMDRCWSVRPTRCRSPWGL